MTYPLRRSTLTLTACLILLSGVLQAAPATLTQSVTYDGETITMRLTKQDLCDDDMSGIGPGIRKKWIKILIFLIFILKNSSKDTF